LREAVKNLADEKTFEMKIIDYGLSREFSSEKEGANKIRDMSKGIGVRAVAPPEVGRSSDIGYNFKVDVWYIGVQFLILLSDNDSIISSKEYWTLEVKPQNDIKEFEKNMHNVSLEGLSFIDSLIRHD